MMVLDAPPRPDWVPVLDAPAEAPVARPARWTWFLPIPLAVAAAAGAITIGISYGRATTNGADRSHYAIFWAGILMFMVPATAFLCSAAASRLARVVTTIGMGLFLYVPKLLRDPTGPLYHDELAHWRQVQDIAAAGHLFVPNTIIPIIHDYPGLHLVTLTIQWSTGLSTWGAAIATLLFCHALSVIAVFLLVEGHTGRARPAAIAAVIYSLNSSFMYFDTQYAYESLAIGLFLVVLLAMQRMENSGSPAERRAWAGMAVCVCATLVATHHLSSVFLVGVLAGWAIVAAWRARRDPSPENRSVARLAWIVAICEVALISAWFAVVAPATVSYLSPYLGNATRQLLSLAGGNRSGTPHSQLFSHSTLPIWERVSALASPVIMLAFTIIALFRWRRHWCRGVTPIILTILGLFFFISIPFIFSSSGAEGAHRSWAFSYAGLAFLIAPAACALLELLPLVRRLAARVAALALFLVVLVGNVATGMNEYYRFPGPYAFGSDTRSITPELIALSNWFVVDAGPEQKVVSDRYTALGLGAFGRQRLAAPSAGFPAYDLWFKDSPPTPFLLGELSSSGFGYLVIDKRTALELPVIGVYFSPDEPADLQDASKLPISVASLDKFEHYPWTEKVLESDNYVVYRFQFGSLGAPLAARRRP